MSDETRPIQADVANSGPLTRQHATAAVLSTGDEIMTGQLLDTNTKYLASELVELGISPRHFAAVGDDRGTLAQTITTLAEKVDLIVMTGGLGPTEGDLTREAIADVLGDALVLDAGAEEMLRAWLALRGRMINERQARQTMRPASAVCLINDIGTAPGLHAVIRRPDGSACDIIAMPGPPGELRDMWTKRARALVRPMPGRTVRTRLLHCFGIPEADLVTKLGGKGGLMDRSRTPLIGVTASQMVLTIRMRYEGHLPASEADRLLDEDERTIRAILGSNVFGSGSQTLPSRVLELLIARKQTVGVCESCTGGLLGKMLTDIAGSSRGFGGGLITYSNELKTKLAGVAPALLAAHGAVSEPVARAMARGTLERLGVDHALSITGIAGPDGGSAEKPVGTVWLAHAHRRSPLTAGSEPTVDAKLYRFSGDRNDIRQRAAISALGLLYSSLVAPQGNQ